MGTTTKLNRVITDCNDTHFLTVFLTKEGHSSHFFGCIDICLNSLDCNCFPDFLIDLLFNGTQFFSSYCLEVRKVKAEEFYFVK